MGDPRAIKFSIHKFTDPLDDEIVALQLNLWSSHAKLSSITVVAMQANHLEVDPQI